MHYGCYFNVLLWLTSYFTVNLFYCAWITAHMLPNCFSLSHDNKILFYSMLFYATLLLLYARKISYCWIIDILFCLCASAYILKMPPRSGSSLFQGVGRLDILEKATLCPPLTSGGGLSRLYSKATVSRLASLEGWHTHREKKCLFQPACNETQQTKKLNQLLKAHISTVCS